MKWPNRWLIGGGHSPPYATERHGGRSLQLADSAFDGALGFIFLVEGGDEGFGSQQEGGDAGRVGQGGADDLHGVDNAGLVHIDVLAGVGVVALIAGFLADFVGDDGAVLAAIVDDGLERS